MGFGKERYGSNLYRHLRAQTVEPSSTEFQHSFYFEGGIHRMKTEKLYLQTLYYKTQIYLKMGYKHSGYHYFGQTIKR